MIAFPNPKPISFRQLIPSVTDTSYATHGLFFHPAKFIPQVVQFCLNGYVPHAGSVFDPFAGSGTTGLEAVIQGKNAYLADLNPLISLFMPIKIPAFGASDWQAIHAQAQALIPHLKANTCPPFSMSELPYWYPPAFHERFTQIWGQFHGLEDNLARTILAIALFKTSKKYSYAEHNMPKLFTTKTKRAWMDNLLGQGIMPAHIDEFIWHDLKTEMTAIYTQVGNFLHTYPQRGVVQVYGGVDSATYSFDMPPVDAIITSPPYLQAQEYIRTFKLELWWAGWSVDAVRGLASLEIPFRKPQYPIQSDYIQTLYSAIADKKRRELLHAYFEYTLATLNNASQHLKSDGYLCVFVGNPQMEHTTIEIWKAIYEHFVTNGQYRLIDLLEDPIKTRKLFGGRNNPNPDGMKSEFMLILQKTS